MRTGNNYRTYLDMSNLERVDEVVGTFLDHLVWVTDTSVHLHCTRLDSENTPAKHTKKKNVSLEESRKDVSQFTSGLSQWHSRLANLVRSFL